MSVTSDVSAAPPTSMSVTFGPSTVAPARVPYRFSVDDYHRMGETGLLPSDARFELLEGVVYMMSPIGAAHSTSVELAYRSLLRILPAGWDVSAQRDVILSTSVPQPDGCIYRGTLRDFADHKPRSSDLALVIEVADASLADDRGGKLRIYAQAGIPEYWIVNLPERKLEVYRIPQPASDDRPARFESVEVLSPEQAVDVVLDGKKVGSIVVRDLLP